MRAGTPDTALKHVADVQLAGHRSQVRVRALEAHRGRPGDHAQRANARQLSNHLVGQTIAEVLLLRIGAQVRKRQDGDGRGFRRNPDDRSRGRGVSGPGLHGFERRMHRSRVPVALARFFLEAALHDRPEASGHFRRQPLGRVLHDGRDDGGLGRSAERQPPAGHLVEQHAQCPDVAPGRGRFTGEHLWSHVRQRSHQHPRV